jgi:hypothetical protein
MRPSASSISSRLRREAVSSAWFGAAVGRLHAARAAFARVRKDRELFEAAGIGPGDAYLALWSHLLRITSFAVGRASAWALV